MIRLLAHDTPRNFGVLMVHHSEQRTMCFVVIRARDWSNGLAVGRNAPLEYIFRYISDLS